MLQRNKTEILKDPPKNIKIWRYISTGKFISMLKHEALTFARVDTLKDPFEGSFSRPTRNRRNELYADNQKKISEIHKKFKAYTFVNCWHMNAYESAAMWNQYA